MTEFNTPPKLPNNPGAAGLSIRMQQLFSGSALVFFGLLLRTGLLLLFELLAARHLGPARYGLFSLAFTVIVIISSLPVLGLQNSLRRFIAFNLETRNSDHVNGLVTFGLIWPLVWGVLFASLLLFFAVPLSNSLFGKPELAPLLKALAFIIPLWSIRRLATVIFSGYKKPHFKVLLEDLLEPLLRVIAALLIVVVGWGAIGLSYSTFVAYLLVGLAAYSLTLKGKREALGQSSGFRLPWRELLVFSAPLIISEFAELILAWLSLLLLGVLSVDYQVGLFRAASQPPMLSSAILTSFAFIYLPTATELFARDDHVGWKRANNAVARWTLSLAFPIGAVCLIFPEQIITIVFGQAYAGGASAMQFLAAAYLIHAACGFTGLNLIVSGHTKLQMIGALLGLALNVCLSLLWIPEHGAAGAAAAILLTVIIRNCYNLLLMKYLLDIVPFDLKYLGVLCIHFVSTAALMLLVVLIDLPDLLGILFLGILELPLAIFIGFRIGVFKFADVDWIMRIRNRTKESLAD